MKLNKIWNIFLLVTAVVLAVLVLGWIFRFLSAVVLKIGGIAVIVALIVLAVRFFSKRS